jgi:hypothetical protein
MNTTYILVSLIDQNDSTMDIFLNIHLEVETEFFLKNKKEIFNNITEIINNTNSVTFKINYIRALKEKPNDETVFFTLEKFNNIADNIINTSAWRSFWTYKYN